MNSLLGHLTRHASLLAEQAKLTADIAAFRSDYQARLDSGAADETAIRALTALRTQIEVSEARLAQLARELVGSDLMICAAIQHHRDLLLRRLILLAAKRREQVEGVFIERLGVTAPDARRILVDLNRRHKPPVFRSLSRTITLVESISASPKDAESPAARGERLLAVNVEAHSDVALTGLQ